jgi:hypothetical protein
MRAMLLNILKDVIIFQMKCLVWCNIPSEQWYVVAVLNLVGIRVQFYYVDLNMADSNNIETISSEGWSQNSRRLPTPFSTTVVYLTK